MRTVGIIAEYNPFHTGHRYHIEQAKKLTDADFAVVVMSPDFVQRGEPAVFDKYTRAEMALRCGADLVLELPVCYATGSAEYFAQGAVSMLEQLGVVDTLCFGSETPDAEAIQTIAGILEAEPEDYRQALHENLKEGLTFPQARAKAMKNYFAAERTAALSLSDLLAAPNNILGIEYCRALHRLHASITPLPIMRKGNAYESTELSAEYSSATAIRAHIAGMEANSFTASERRYMEANSYAASEHRYTDAAASLLPYIPSDCLAQFQNACNFTLRPDDLLPYLTQKLLTASGTDLGAVLDISPDLADRIDNLRYSCIGKAYADIVSLLKTRQMTEARIRRALLHLILDIREDTIQNYRHNGTVFYAHVLGFRRSAGALLHEIKLNGQIPLLTKMANADRVIAQWYSGPSNQRIPDLTCPAGCMLRQDLFASHLYRSIAANKYNVPFQTEYQKSPVIL